MKKQKCKNRREKISSERMTIPVHKNFAPTSPYAQFMKNMEIARRYAEQNGLESPEEADDFDCDEDFDPTSPWELEFDPVAGKEVPKEIAAETRRAKQQFDAQVASQKKKPAKRPASYWKQKREKLMTEEEYLDSLNQDK